MEKTLTLAEIEAQFDGEWVLVGNPQTNDALEIQSGQVLYHSKNRDEFDRKVLEFRAPRVAILFTGKAPEQMEFIL